MMLILHFLIIICFPSTVHVDSLTFSLGVLLKISGLLFINVFYNFFKQKNFKIIKKNISKQLNT
jgi:hypothetical protein